jgi:hypothetical protein
MGWNEFVTALNGVDWEQKKAAIAAQKANTKLQGDELAMRLADSQSQNALRKQALDQGNQSFGPQLEALKMQIEQERQAAPQRQFADLVGAYGGPTGGRAFVQQQPELAQQLFNKGQEYGPPDIRGNAETVGKNLYNLGPETARKITEQSTITANQYPFQAALSNLQGGIQERIARVGQGASAAEHEKNRQASGAGAALQNFTTNPALASSLPALESKVEAVKTADQARALIGELGSLRSQIKFALSSATTIGNNMGAPAALSGQLQAMASEALSRIDGIHRQLFNKYWGPKTTTKSSSFIDTLGTGPDTLGGGYTP